MKKYLLLLFLISCTTTKFQYNCASLTMHGVYAQYQIIASSEIEAQKEAEKVNQELINKNLIPDKSFAQCF